MRESQKHKNNNKRAKKGKRNQIKTGRKRKRLFEDGKRVNRVGLTVECVLVGSFEKDAEGRKEKSATSSWGRRN